MRPLLPVVLALVLLVPATPWPAPAAEDKLVVYTAYEENELKTFWEQFKKDLPDLAVNQKKMTELRLTPPQSWADLLDPKYKGHIVMSNPSTSGTAYLLLASHAARLGEDKMWQYYEALDKNLSQVTKSGGAPGRMAASGETPIGVALAYEVEVAKRQGAPIDVIYPADGIAWTFEGNALVKGAKNPQNAKRFLDWAVSKAAMTSYASWRGAALTRTDVPVSGQKISEMNLIAIDFVKAGDPAYKDRLVKRWLEKFSR